MADSNSDQVESDRVEALRTLHSAANQAAMAYEGTDTEQLLQRIAAGVRRRLCSIHGLDYEPPVRPS